MTDKRNSSISITKRRMAGIISAVLILVTAISFVMPWYVSAANDDEAKGEKESKQAEVAMPEVSSSSYIVMSGSTSEVVLSKHETRKMQPGSITMLMTAMVVIDNMYNEEELKNAVTIDKKLAKYGDTFKEGEEVTIGDLLTAMLVGGDPQAAEALALYSASSREIFINEMNSKCMQLRIMDTQFDNPSGSFSQSQYATAWDLAVITQAAIRYQKIKDALAMQSAVVTARAKDKEREIEIASSDPLISTDPNKGYSYINGGISGTMNEPKTASQFAAVATKDDMQLVCILMDSDQKAMGNEAKGLFEYADTKVTKNVIVKGDKKVGHARIKGGASTRVAAYTEHRGFAYVPPEGSEELIQTQVVMFDGLEAPMKAGDKVGEFRIFVADELKGTVDLIIKKDVPKGWAPSKIYISNLATVLICTILGLLFLFTIRVLSVKKQRERRREAMRRQRIRALARKQMEIDEDRMRRNWTATGYDNLPPRTTDIRREQIEREIRERKRKQKEQNRHHR